ncbi:class I adenylate-forming enzyme family protein [Blastococcus saxobsidens]|uniref:Long chain acyl-CoA synthetase (AMP-forming) /AMP-acid ligase II n=1 Tax=Blastococcus saxobsidens (strain DD2) TaxID=1146883 RepID=H6RNC8_BLASD|nr:AMP-binding protein [Blastococcus saxobsidens]CCG02676.1 Long chain acyl-CoA synthetase (AMP-forming) /AMP-acid ligase II [Blastococcus saxobsidens DD2]
MSSYDDRPWLAVYGDQPADYAIEFESALDMFRTGVERDPSGVALRYFDGTITRRELDELTDGLASGLLANGFAPGDRLAVYLQNVPQFVIAMVATWKAGGVMVSINPMSRQRELSYLVTDSGATVLLALESLYDQVAREVVPDTDVRLVLTTSELDFQTRNDERLFAGVTRQRHEGTVDLLELIDRHRGQTPPPVGLRSDDVAFLTYTSGTTGVPKGAMNTHRNVVFTAQVYRDWVRAGRDGAIFGIAPLFHITGLIGHVAVSLLVPAPLVLAYRFEPQVVLDAFVEHRPASTIGAITAFTALLNAPGCSRDHFASFTSVYSGGAAISPTAEQAFLAATGKQVHSAYGLTETTSPMTVTPLGATSPVDPTSGALSVGVPAPNTVVRIQDDEGRDLPLGEIGEIVAAGPQIVAGYWGKPEETAASLPGGALKSGDVGFLNPEGWVFIVDRKKDMINASGYKVWPREVEDVLAEHPAVRESAVVGVPDEKRGETVKAFVSLKAGAAVTEDDLIAHCKERMAAYKYPRSVELVDELPKTVTGKILRRELRG